MNLFKEEKNNVHKTIDMEGIKIRKALEKDLEEIYKLACSCCYKENEESEKLLYPVEYYKDNIKSLENFYVAEEKGIIGYVIAYEKEIWIKKQPSWINEVVWHPQFQTNVEQDFIIIDEIAVDEVVHQGIKELFYDFMIKKAYKRNIPYVFKEVIVSPIPNISSIKANNKNDFMLSGIRYINRNEQLYTNLIYCKPTRDYR